MEHLLIAIEGFGLQVCPGFQPGLGICRPSKSARLRINIGSGQPCAVTSSSHRWASTFREKWRACSRPALSRYLARQRPPGRFWMFLAAHSSLLMLWLSLMFMPKARARLTYMDAVDSATLKCSLTAFVGFPDGRLRR